MDAQMEEQTCASATVHSKNVELEGEVQSLKDASAAVHSKIIELEDEVQSLKEQLANEVAERKRIQEEEKNARNTLREQLREEMLAMIAQHKEATPQQTNPESNIPIEPAAMPTMGIRKIRISNVNQSLFQNNSGTMSASYITTQQLRSCAAKTHARTRSEQREDTI